MLSKNRNIALCTEEEIREAIEAIPVYGLTTKEQTILGFLHNKTLEWINNESIYKDWEEEQRHTIALLYLSWYIQDHGIIPTRP